MKAGLPFAVIAAVIAVGAAAQQPPPAPVPAPSVRAVPMVPLRQGPPRFSGSKRLVLPRQALDEGHNGSVTWRTRVSADGKVLSMELLESSGSPAIDEAAQAQILQGRISPARDAAGNAIEGTGDLWLQFALWNKDSSGVGIELYRCADLTREYAWFLKANAQRRKDRVRERLFVPENVYVGRKMFAWRVANGVRDQRQIASQRAEFTKGWVRIMTECRAEPDSLMIDHVDEPAAFRSWL